MIYQLPNGEPVAEEPAAEEPETTRVEIGVRLVTERASLWWIAFDLIGAVLFTYIAITGITDTSYFAASCWIALALFMVLELSRDIHGY